ncbi:probable F420-dependent oxidoreductase, MSMEG_4141 family [Streptomyces himastatinicus ATCC 53653]|uniref:Probable F420-dependent oxidoreductase, MSMEG_4141 family n=1 Tax=Streptomyces himastatinicus ATCC 53653 TaxID=457427 RepID=D9WA17_9ACTN|nr:LLM class F420-dependent oxidoreductase [Streptomyces himastatinicus]EFL24813.1 probable F420-dependent oxidoreductase, MSMEG_4141 family [Streptomyces himastatinicus ATCC 53653]
MATQPALGKIGIWTAALRVSESRSAQEVSEAAAELDALGYGTLWFGGSPSADQAATLLEATDRITVATGILSIWDHSAAHVADRYAAIDAAHPGRFVLGLGVSHSALAGERYKRPYSAMRDYLTDLDSAPIPVPASRRVLAALGPKMLELSRDRAAGAHPYLVTPEFTAEAREILGDGALLAPDLKVVLDTDLDRARTTARNYLSMYLKLPNYTNNLLRWGFEEKDFADGGSERLVNSVFALGDAEAIRRRVDTYLEAGADHLAVQVVTSDPFTTLPREEWRTLAEALPLGSH